MSEARRADQPPSEEEPQAWEESRVPTSRFLVQLLDQASSESVTVGWIIDQLSERSFGLFLLILGVIGIAPGLSTFIGVILLVPAVQMMLARRSPSLPRFLAEWQLPTAKLRYGIGKAVPLLRGIENLVKPRWPTGVRTTKRVVGAITFLLGLSMLGPIPFSQVLPAITITLLALAYLEDDGLVLAIGILIAVISLLITVATIWAAILAGDAIFDRL